MKCENCKNVELRTDGNYHKYNGKMICTECYFKILGDFIEKNPVKSARTFSYPSRDIDKRAAVCPICHGSGIGYNFPHGLPSWRGEPPEQFRVPCHGCSGKGWVSV